MESPFTALDTEFKSIRDYVICLIVISISIVLISILTGILIATSIQDIENYITLLILTLIIKCIALTISVIGIKAALYLDIGNLGSIYAIVAILILLDVPIQFCKINLVSGGFSCLLYVAYIASMTKIDQFLKQMIYFI